MNKLSIVKDNFKELPNNIEAEQAVLGSILVSNDIFDEINIIISNINFYDPMHQKIFSAIESLIYKGLLANPITLKNYFENEKDDINIFNQKMIKFLKFVKFDEDEKKYTNVEFLDEVEKNGTQIWKRKGNTKFNFYDTTYRIVDEINIDQGVLKILLTCS